MSIKTYTANLTPLNESGVTSTVRLFTFPSPDVASPLQEGMTCFVGSATGLEPNLASVHQPGGTGTNCGDTNGCGVHIHAGFGADACLNGDTQGGHYWNSDVLNVDPWAVIGYFSTDADGNASYAGCVPTGFDFFAEGDDLLDGRAFIVHANDGSRVSCGTLALEAEPTHEVLTTSTEALGENAVASDLRVLTNVLPEVADAVCFLGTATGLESNVASVYDDQLADGTMCGDTNGCGLHVHAGVSCADNESQGGHYYDKETEPVDPWLITSYGSTDGDGNAAFADCVLTGETEYMGFPFIVHNTDGSRASCGLLETDEDMAPAPTPDSAGKRKATLLAGFLMAYQLLVGLA